MVVVQNSLMLSFEDGPECLIPNNLTKKCNFALYVDIKVLTLKHMLTIWEVIDA